MDALVRTLSASKDGDGEVTDAEDNRTATTQRSHGEQREKSGSSPTKPRHHHVIENSTASATIAAMEARGNLVTDEIPAEDLADNEDEEEEEDEYEYEDDDDAAFSGFLVDNPAIAVAAATVEAAAPATIRDEDEQDPKPKWRQPSEEAVNMSLRAQKETTGGKRRLAQDLYRIMNQDTEEAGFSLKPSSEDSMDKWTIQLFQFDEDSKLAKDMKVLGLSNIELEMSFPDQYPFEPPFVRVTRPRFKRQTGFVMNGALCMELLTNDGWNPINDIESVIVSIRSLLVVGDGRLEAAYNLPEAKYNTLLEAASKKSAATGEPSPHKKQRTVEESTKKEAEATEQQRRLVRDQGGAYSVSEAQAAYSHLSDYHKKKGWDNSGWWARKG